LSPSSSVQSSFVNKKIITQQRGHQRYTGPNHNTPVS
jgi:hypothetical protein